MSLVLSVHSGSIMHVDYFHLSILPYCFTSSSNKLSLKIHFQRLNYSLLTLFIHYYYMPDTMAPIALQALLNLFNKPYEVVTITIL